MRIVNLCWTNNNNANCEFSRILLKYLLCEYISLIRNRAVKKKVCTDIVQTYLVSLPWSFLPCRCSFDPILSCQGSRLGNLDVIRPKNYEIPRKIEEELLLLVPSDFSNSGEKAL